MQDGGSFKKKHAGPAHFIAKEWLAIGETSTNRHGSCLLETSRVYQRHLMWRCSLDELAGVAPIDRPAIALPSDPAGTAVFGSWYSVFGVAFKK